MPDTQTDQDAVSKFLANYQAFQPPPPPPSLLAQGLAPQAPAQPANPLYAALSAPGPGDAPAPEAPSAPKIAAPGDMAPAIKIPKLDTSGEPYPTIGQTPEDKAAAIASAKAASTEASKPGLDTLWAREANIHNPILKALARAGTVGLHVLNAAGSAIAPEVMAQIPGTPWHHAIQVEQAEGQAADAQKRATNATADTAAQIAANNASLQPQVAEDKIDAMTAQHAAQLEQKDRAIAAVMQKAGMRVKTDSTTGQAVRDAAGNTLYEDDPDSEAAKEKVAATNLKNSVASYKKYQSDLAEAQTEKDKAWVAGDATRVKQAQERIDNARAHMSVEEQSLGLRAQQFGFEKDKFYNPQPTGTERNKADLAQSALDQIAAMRSIVNKRPDLFGPGGGRLTNLQTAIGNNDPDVATYNAAAEYLADHSAAVFGGRGEYIMKSLSGLTDPKFNPDALKATLSQAESTAQNFKNSGTVHSDPNTRPSTPAATYKRTATNAQGVKLGTNDDWKTVFDVKTGKQVQ